MNDYAYEDIEVGRSASFSVENTDEMMESFLSVTGDCNPLHVDPGYARGEGFADRVVYGMLVSSFYSTLAGVHLPGKRCVLQSVDIRMRKPVYVGDVLEVSGSVREKHDALKVVVIDAKAVNQFGEKVSKARIQAGVLR